eukprot:6064527-Prymnesium_polylepis.1
MACRPRIADALHAERTLASIAHAADRVRAARQHHHPCPPSAARRWALAGWCGEGWWVVGGECGRAWARLWAAGCGGSC